MTKLADISSTFIKKFIVPEKPIRNNLPLFKDIRISDNSTDDCKIFIFSNMSFHPYLNTMLKKMANTMVLKPYNIGLVYEHNNIYVYVSNSEIKKTIKKTSTNLIVDVKKIISKMDNKCIFGTNYTVDGIYYFTINTDIEICGNTLCHEINNEYRMRDVLISEKNKNGEQRIIIKNHYKNGMVGDFDFDSKEEFYKKLREPTNYMVGDFDNFTTYSDHYYANIASYDNLPNGLKYIQEELPETIETIETEMEKIGLPSTEMIKDTINNSVSFVIKDEKTYKLDTMQTIFKVVDKLSLSLDEFKSKFQLSDNEFDTLMDVNNNNFSIQLYQKYEMIKSYV
jgi:hypothetical protein